MLGWVGDEITGAMFYRNLLRGFGVTGPPPQTPFPILNVHRPYNSVSNIVLHCDSINVHFNSPSLNPQGSKRPGHAHIKKGVPPKSQYFTAVGSPSVKMVADRHWLAAYVTSNPSHVKRKQVIWEKLTWRPIAAVLPPGQSCTAGNKIILRCE